MKQLTLFSYLLARHITTCEAFEIRARISFLYDVIDYSTNVYIVVKAVQPLPNVIQTIQFDSMYIIV